MSTALNLLHRAVAHGWVYDFSQFLAGAPLVRRHLRPLLADCQSGSRILDLGGGTGFLEQMVPSSCSYICLDVEMPKLLRYVEKARRPKPLQADAALLPIRDGCIDMVTCITVAHHLTAEMLEGLLEESRRVLRPGGRFLLLDAVFSPRRWPGRLLWALDRGAYPKTAGALRSAVAGKFYLRYWRRFALYHEYALAMGVR